MTALERYVEFMEKVAEFDLKRIDEFIAEDIHFVDPFNDARGIAHYRRIIADMREQLADLTIDVKESAMVSDESALIFWRLGGNLRAFKGRHWAVDGCSRVAFNQRGQVTEHLDFWDAAGQLYETFPGLGTILRYVRKKLAVD
ncbi:MAG: nuclear transport factor 2 family protein [Gammaproteobacteria bacterium]